MTYHKCITSCNDIVNAYVFSFIMFKHCIVLFCNAFYSIISCIIYVYSTLQLHFLRILHDADNFRLFFKICRSRSRLSKM